MKNGNSCWEILLKVSLGVLLILSFLQFKVKFGWDPIKYLEEISRKPQEDNSILVQVESIKLLDSMRVNINEPQCIQVMIEPENATDKRIEWICDTTVAKIDASGFVTVIDSVDCTTICARAMDGSNSKAEIKILVNNITSNKSDDIISPIVAPLPDEVKIGSIEFKETNVNLKVGESVRIHPHILPGNASNKTVKWESSNNEIARVNDGTIVGVKYGTCEIYVSSMDGSQISNSIKVKVDQDVKITDIEFKRRNIEIRVGETARLSPSIIPTNASNKSLLWESSNSHIATVNNGIVEGINDGTCIVTVSSTDGSNKSYRISINVKPEQKAKNIVVFGGSAIFDSDSREITITKQMEFDLQKLDDSTIVLSPGDKILNAKVVNGYLKQGEFLRNGKKTFIDGLNNKL